MDKNQDGTNRNDREGWQSRGERPRGKPERRIHGRHGLRPCITFDQTVHAAIGGDRLEIVIALSHGALSVGQLVLRVGLNLKAVSRELKHLEEFGLVEWSGSKNAHIYHLSERIKVHLRDDKVQFNLRSDAGHWAWFNIDEGGQGEPVEPPDFFIDAKTVRPVEALTPDAGREEDQSRRTQERSQQFDPSTDPPMNRTDAKSRDE